jgi:hypothetical protein
MPTTPLAGNRASRTRNPRDLTGKQYTRQHAEQKAKEDAAKIDIAAVRKAARSEGFSEGWDAGFQAGWNALAQHLVEIGVLDPDEPEEAAE